MQLQYSEVMVRYGELSTKGKNKKKFINKLTNNVKFAFHDFEQLQITGERDRMHLELNGADSDLVLKRLKSIFGIQNFSPVIRLERDIEKMLKGEYEDLPSFLRKR